MKKLVSILIISLLVTSSLLACTSGSTQKQTTGAKVGTSQWQSEMPIKEPINATTSDTQSVTIGDLATQQVEVIIPPGMLSAGTTVTVTNLENAPPMANSIGTPVGAPVSISAGDQPTRLKELMTVTLKFDPGNLPSGTKADNLWATYYDGTNWRPFRPDSVDMQAGSLTFTTDHLTGFGQLKIDVEAHIEAAVHSKVIAETVQKEALKNNIDDYTEKAIDYVLVDGLGMKEGALKTQVLQTVLKDDEFGDVKDGLTDKVLDPVKVAQATNILVGKAIARNVDSSTMEALVGGDKVNESLKRGEGADWVKSVSQTAGFIAEGRYRDAAEILGTKIAMQSKTVKAAVAAREVIQWRMDVWRNDKIEQAYKIYRFGAEANHIIGVRDVDAGDFNGVWDNMEAASRQLMIEAIAREKKQRMEDDRPLLTAAEEAKLRTSVRTEMEKQFKERVKQDEEIEKQKANLDKLLKDPDMLRIIEGSAIFDATMTMDYKIDRLAHFQGMVLNDTRGKFVSNNLMAQLALQWYGTADKEQARLNYAKLLKEKLGVVPAWAETSPLPTAAAGPLPAPEAVIAPPLPYTLGAWNEPSAAFGTQDNPLTVRLSGSIKGDAGLKFEGVESYLRYGDEDNVIAFVYSIPATATKSVLDFDGLVIPASVEPSKKTIKFTGTKPQNETTTFTDDATYTWLGWGGSLSSGGPIKMREKPIGGRPYFEWTAGKPLTINGAVMLDTVRNGEGTLWDQAGGVMFKIEFKAQRLRQGRDMETGGLGLPSDSGPVSWTQNIAIRLVKR